MSKYKYVLWDLDGTILDFEAAEKAAIKSLFDRFHLGKCSEEMLASYSEINKKYWQMLERGEMKKDQILVKRFEEFFTQEGIDSGIAEAFNKEYQLSLGDTIVFQDDAISILKKQKKTCKIAIVTNGTTIAQKKKLEQTGLNDIVDNVFVSEIVGFEKPNRKFFENVIDAMNITDLEQVIVIGDSLTSDIQGGHNIGIDTCWYNPKNVPNDSLLIPTYTIHNLFELESII